MNLRDVAGFALGPIGAALIGLVTVPVIAWVFPQEDVGRLNIVQITISFGVLLFSLGLDQAYVREFHEASDRAALLKACFLPGFVVTVLALLAIAPFASRLSGWLFGLARPIYYWIAVACVVVSFISRYLSLILRMEERGLAYSMSQILPKALLLVVVGSMAVAAFHKNFILLECALLLSLLSVLITYGWNTRFQWMPACTASLSLSSVKRLLAFGTPLILAGVAFWGLAATSSITLRSLSTLSELALYSVSMSFAGVGAIFQGVFSVVWAPLVYKWVANGVDMRRVDHVAQQALALVCAIFALCGTFSWLTDFILPHQYDKVKYLMLCSVAQPLLYTLSEVTCVGIGITRRTALSLWATVAALIANVVLNVWLVPKHGAAGAVIANAIAFVVFFVTRTEASAHVWRPFPRARLYAFVVGGVGMSIATIMFGSISPIHYSLMWMASLPIVGWSFRKEWVEMYKALHKTIVLRDKGRRSGCAPDAPG